MTSKDPKSWILKRQYALKILNCAFDVIAESEDFVEGSKKIEPLLSEFEREIRKSLIDKINL